MITRWGDQAVALTFSALLVHRLGLHNSKGVQVAHGAGSDCGRLQIGALEPNTGKVPVFRSTHRGECFINLHRDFLPVEQVIPETIVLPHKWRYGRAGLNSFISIDLAPLRTRHHITAALTDIRT